MKRVREREAALPGKGERGVPFSFNDTSASPMHPLSPWKRPTLPGWTRVGHSRARVKHSNKDIRSSAL